MSHTESTLTKKQILFSRIALGAAIILLGIFLLLCGLDAVKVRLAKAVLPAVLVSAALVCFAWAFIQDNTLMLWLSFPLLFSAIVTILVLCTSYGYGDFYPLYIVSPAVGSFVTAIYGGEWRDHLKSIVLFATCSAIFMLNSAFGVSWGVVIPVLLLFFGAYVTIYSILRRNK